MRRLLLLALVASSIAACDKSSTSGPADAGVVDGGPSHHDGGLAPCLDRPTNLAQPPNGPLPCELIPPGFNSTH